GSRVLSGSADGTVGIWNTASGERLASLIGTRDGEWLSITPSGFFAAPGNSPHLLSIVRRFEVTAIDQVWQSLFNPDLVRLSLGDDPDGEVRDAANVVNLEKVLDSGPAPGVAILSPGDGSKPASDVVVVKARIADNGRGVGRIEWRVNGVTAAVAPGPS